MNFKLNIGKIIVEGDLQSEVDAIKKEFNEDLKRVATSLGQGAFENAKKLAQQKLPSALSNMYIENLKLDVQENVFIIELDEKYDWIEKGRKKGFMEELLTGKSSKTSKDGTKYAVIPIENKSSNTNTSKSNQDLVKDLKNFLRSEGVGHSKTGGLVLDEKGSPRVGKMYAFDIKDIRNKKSKSAENLARSIQGVNVYQNKNPATGKVERNVMAFRVISEKHRSSGKWIHPGTPPARIMEETFKWVSQTFYQQILPDLKKKYEGK